MNFNKKKIIIFVLTGVICISIISIVLLPSPDSESKELTKTVVPEVSVIEAAKTEGRMSMKLMGEMLPEWETSITSRVEGEITYLSPRLKEGNIVKKGELLVRIENSAYRLGVSEARLRMAQAKLSLLREKNEAEEALSSWKTSGLKGKPDSPLVLRKPYVAAAEKEVQAAQDSLNRAHRELEYTEIRSPINGLVVKRSVSIGATLFSGNEIAVIYGVDKGTVSVFLSMKQWDMLPENLTETEVILSCPVSKTEWIAKIVRDGRVIQKKTRQRQVFIEIDKPLEQKAPLLPGTFLNVNLTGKRIENLLEIPESALTRKGAVWFVTKDETLLSVKATILFRHNGSVFIEYPETKERSVNGVAIAPNSSFVNGRKVLPGKVRKEI